MQFPSVVRHVRLREPAYTHTNECRQGADIRARPQYRARSRRPPQFAIAKTTRSHSVDIPNSGRYANFMNCRRSGIGAAADTVSMRVPRPWHDLGVALP
jgi:hypothetical protein